MINRGVVVSDLHLFTRRSDGVGMLAACLDALTGVNCLVLNGDIFDFQWTTLPTIEAVIERARDWLTDLLHRFPHLSVYYLLGNHDCRHDFVVELEKIQERYPAFQWKADVRVIGKALFLHGDCANWKMTYAQWKQYRIPWQSLAKRSFSQDLVDEAMNRTGLIGLFHRLCFPRRLVAGRILHYLESTPGVDLSQIRDIYFGHTHLPFSGYVHSGYHFHNSGSGITGMGWKPLLF